MHLFNTGSFFNEDAFEDILKIVDNSEKLRERLIELKKMLLNLYNFKVYNLSDDFTNTSYVIASNHLTDADAPLIMSYYYEVMHEVIDTYPRIFVFAKENCFNGVSIPKELAPILEMEKVISIDRNTLWGSKAGMTAARKWFEEDKNPKHFLIFCQGTIYDINNDNEESIEEGALWLAKMLEIPVLPAFIEQAVEKQENRLIFAKPFLVPKDYRITGGYKKLLLDSIVGAQKELKELTGIPARKVVLDAEHIIRKKLK